MELDAISQPQLEQFERFTPADVVIGIFDSDHRDGSPVELVREVLAGLPRPAKTVIVCNHPGPVPEAFAVDSAPEALESIGVLHSPLSGGGPAESRQSLLQAYPALLGIARKLEAKACAVVASQFRAITPQWIHGQVQPLLELGFDLVAPVYARHNLEGMLNRSILAPLYRALYGEQLRNPLGPDFGISNRLLEMLTNLNGASRRNQAVQTAAPVAAIASTAACGNFQICESYLGASTQPPTDWNNLSSLLADVLGPVFAEVERQAPAWQRIRGSRSAPAFGSPAAPPAEGASVDVGRLIESFQLGSQNLQDVWGLVLPPTSLFELKKLSRLAPAQFRMPDDLWARSIYDFALGYRLRTISRDHLLRSFTPLYLGWIASYVLELESAPGDAEGRMERLARAFETAKPYLVSRWRWPDRFNP